MKRLYLLFALAGLATVANAQSEEPAAANAAKQAAAPVEKYSVATNSFGSNWFVQASFTGSVFYSDQEHGMQLKRSKDMFKDFRDNLGFSIAVGKWFSPDFGLRTKLNGIWGRTVISEDKATNASKYWLLQENALINLSNIICGYNQKRLWNFIPYLGAGFGRNMSYNKYSFGLNIGLLNTFRLCDKLSAHIDVNMGVYEPDFDGVEYKNPFCKKFFAQHDLMYNVEIGLTYNLGKGTWNKTPDVEAIKALSQSQIDALNAQIADALAENDKLRGLLASQKPTETVKTVRTVVSAPVSVFFNLGKSRIASRKDVQNVKALVEAAKTNDAKLTVTGYADSKTGSAEYNRALSQKRAETVADEIVRLGLTRDKIEVKAEGGVNTLTPVSYNRRATVTVK